MLSCLCASPQEQEDLALAQALAASEEEYRRQQQQQQQTQQVPESLSVTNMLTGTCVGTLLSWQRFIFQLYGRR